MIMPQLKMLPYLCSYQSTAASSSVSPASPVQPSPWPAWLSWFSPPILFFCCFLSMPPTLEEMIVSVWTLRKTKITWFAQILCLHEMRGEKKQDMTQYLEHPQKSWWERNVHHLYMWALLIRAMETEIALHLCWRKKQELFSAATCLCFSLLRLQV